MNFDYVVERMTEAIETRSSLYGFFPDMKNDYVKRVRLEKAIDGIMKRMERRGIKCVRDEHRAFDIILCCNGKTVTVVIVAFKGGIEEAIMRVYRISEGELHKYKRELKEGKLPGKFKGGFRHLLEEVLGKYQNLLTKC